jgi:multidrug efflux system membrane fusion protein
MKRAALWLLGLLIVLLAAFAGYSFLSPQTGGATTSAGNAPQQRPLPVTAAIVAVKDFPVYRVGLGTVQAYNTVTVKVRSMARYRR